MKKPKSKFLKILGLLICVFALAGCTKPLRTNQDKCSIMMSYEDFDEGEKFGNYGEKSKTSAINEFAKEEGYLLPSDEFNAFMEEKISAYVVELRKFENSKGEKPYQNQTEKYLRAIATFGGATSDESGHIDYSKNTMWSNYNSWLSQAIYELGIEKCPDRNYISYYQNSFNTLANNYTTTITPIDDDYSGVTLEGKSWKEAFDYGLIEGLLVYPVSWLLYQFSHIFGLNGWGQIMAIFLVTIIVRGILVLLTFKQTLAQQKMTQLQPELAKIQAKYPNAQTNQYEKQRMAQEQMALYKKNKINPMGSFIVIFFQFPIFIAVWGAMQGSAVLMDGDLLGLSLAVSTGPAMINFKSLSCITAWVIFLLMAAGQYVSMKLPQWMQKKKANSVEKLGKNPTMDQSQKTTNMVSTMMLIFIIFMGFSLPVAMTIYWFISSLISVLQTFIIQGILQKKQEKKHVKYKTKK